MDVNEIGWKVVDGCLEIEWDDPSNFEQVKESVRLLDGVNVRRAVTIDGAHVSKLVGNVDRDVASYM